MDIGKFVISKLNGTNYLVWACQVEALLQARGLWSHVCDNDFTNQEMSQNESVAIEGTTTTTATTQGIEKEKSMARAAIICTIEPEYIPMVAGEQNARKIWQKLANDNKPKCVASIHTLRKRLLNMSMGHGTTIREFANEICNIERQLSFAGTAVNEEDKKYALLNGWRREFEIKKTILQENIGMDFEKMVSSLEMMEDELKSIGRRTYGSSSNGSSFITNGCPHRNKIRCHICDKVGHKMYNCFYNPRSKKYKAGWKRTPLIEAKLKQHGLLKSATPANGRDDCKFAFMANRSNSIKQKWFLDSCCSRRITNNRESMVNYRSLDKIETVNAASEGDGARIIGVGDINVRQTIDGKVKHLLLKNVGYAPNCRTNLISLPKAQRKGAEIVFVGSGTKLVAKYNDEVIMTGDSKATGIAELSGMVPDINGLQYVVFYNAGENDCMKLAHRRTCHTSVATLKRMHDTNVVDGLDAVMSTKNVDEVCEACVEGKAASTPQRRREKSTKKPLELMHTDLCGPISPSGTNGERYMQLLVDDYSGAIFVSTMTNKDGAGHATKSMVLHAQKLAKTKVGTIRPDNAKELKLGNVKKLLDENETLIDEIPPYSPLINGRVERQNRTILEKARTILAELNMMCTCDEYKKLWPEAVQCVVYVYNRTLTKSTHKGVRTKTPYEVITGNKPDLSNLRIFGTKVKVLKPKSYRRSKVESKTWTGIHVGYAPGDAYRSYIPEL